MHAWLGLKPDGQAAPNGQHYDVPLPDVPLDNPAVVTFWQDMGLALSSGMGLTPITFTEIKAYAQMTRTRLSTFEAQAIRQMSIAFVSVASNPKADPPGEIQQDIQNAIAKKHLEQWINAAVK